MVTPANEIPEVVGQRRGAKLAICNLQKTPLDRLSDLRIDSKTDDLMTRVMEKLNIPIPPFILQRRLVVEMETQEGKRHQLTVYGVDVDGTPITFLRSVKLHENRRVARSEPFVINFRGDLESGVELKFELEFMGHYNEPNLEITHIYYNERDTRTLHLLDYNPHAGEWIASKQGDDMETSDKAREDMDEGNANFIRSEDASASNNVAPTAAAGLLPVIVA
jgi:mono-ADP-ribosyltransferase sirtuin 6